MKSKLLQSLVCSELYDNNSLSMPDFWRGCTTWILTGSAHVLGKAAAQVDPDSKPRNTRFLMLVAILGLMVAIRPTDGKTHIGFCCC